MRPSEAFGRPRPAAVVDADAAAAAPLAVCLDRSGSASGAVAATGSGGAGAAGGAAGPGTAAAGGIATAPMMTYFLADEADVDAALAAAGGDPEALKAGAGAQHLRHLPCKAAEASGGAGRAGPPHALNEDYGEDDDDDDAPSNALPRPRTPDAGRPHAVRHSHMHSSCLAHGTASTTSGHPTGPAPLPPVLPPSFSPLFSQSATTSLFGTPGPASLSAMSNPSSRRNSLSSSLMDETPLCGGGSGGSGVHSGLDELDGARDGDGTSLGAGAPTTSVSSVGTSHRMADSGSAPQLIMPSIQMPSRRPFTATGKSMGRLKVLIAGGSGVGKTSLIKAIVQSCPHIVHVDPISPPPAFSLSTSRRSSAATTATAATVIAAAAGTDAAAAPLAEGGPGVRVRRRSSRASARPDQATACITEIYASTKPYPPWWNEPADDSRVGGSLRRRKSLGDSVLDRNLCFVDTPGFDGHASTMDTIMPVVEYVEAAVRRLCGNTLSDAEFASLVSGDGGLSVDVVLYLVAGDLQAADVAYLQRLAPLTNVVLLLARADTLPTESDVAGAKARVARQLHAAGIQPFVFAAADSADAPAEDLPQPYAVSSAAGSDHDVMDASLLMSPDYVQPLVATELAALVDRIFCPDGAARLRHAAARKLARWRAAEPTGAGSGSICVSSPLAGRPRLGAGVLTAPLGAPSSFALARVVDHVQREEHVAQARLATWAAELQRHLDSERARFEALARSERAVWLTERLRECVQDGTLVAVAPAPAPAPARTTRTRTRGAKTAAPAATPKKTSAWSPSAPSARLRAASSLAHEDPLGLLEVAARLRARSLLALELLGSLGVLGGVALWMARHDHHQPLYEWLAGAWARLSSGER